MTVMIDITQGLGLTYKKSPHTMKFLRGEGRNPEKVLTFKCETCGRLAYMNRLTWNEMVLNRHNPFNYKLWPKGLETDAHIRRMAKWAVCPNPKRKP